MSTIVLTLLAVVSAVIHMRAEYVGPVTQIYVFKPLTMLLIITLAVMAQRPSQPRYKKAVLAGLLFSLAGDVFLMLPTDMFVPGLVSFLIAHLIYIYAFRLSTKLRFSWQAVLPFVLYGAAIFGILAPGLGDMMLPVLAYVVVIMTMVWQAWEQWAQNRARWALLAFAGAALFVLSDSALALNKFGEPFAAARALTLTTYFSAQWLIGFSIRKQ